MLILALRCFICASFLTDSIVVNLHNAISLHMIIFDQLSDEQN